MGNTLKSFEYWMVYPSVVSTDNLSLIYMLISFEWEPHSDFKIFWMLNGLSLPSQHWAQPTSLATWISTPTEASCYLHFKCFHFHSKWKMEVENNGHFYHDGGKSKVQIHSGWGIITDSLLRMWPNTNISKNKGCHGRIGQCKGIKSWLQENGSLAALTT